MAKPSAPSLEGVTPFPSEYVARYREKGYWEDRPLIAHFDEVFRRHGDRVAVIDGDQRVTFREVGERARRAGRNLLDLGVKPLDRVLLQLPNAIGFVDLYFGLQTIGGIPITALPSHRYREASQFVRLAGAVATATPLAARDFSFTEMVDRLRREAPSLRLAFVHGGPPPDGFIALSDLVEREPAHTDADLARIQAALDPCDPCVLQLSGGTTGVPKLIPRTHNDYPFNSKLAVSVCGVHEGDVLLAPIPLAHNLPLACPGLQGFLLKGATTVLTGATRASDVLPLIERHRVTHLEVVPALLISWLNDPLINEVDLSSVRVIQSAAQRTQPELKVRVERTFRGATLQENFGMTEGLLMFVRLDDPADVRLETVGRPICPDDEVRLVDDDGNDVADGETGELLARGPYTLRGYFRAPEHNARAFTPDGFYRSGDLMRRHPSGSYVVEGRKKDVINRGGEKISAEEVENLILAHPAVRNVACVAMPDPVLGERMCACVILHPGASLTLEELVRHLRAEEIQVQKLPERLEIMDSFPLSPIGKVSKKDLAVTVAKKVEAGT